ncbi:hypothetical protein [Paraburkholderia sediminicola]|uniref:hypothetical protein n=1 Tax=Paraburkholderia sediminicola TaxID=458836 RepID=UPI0038BBC494
MEQFSADLPESVRQAQRGEYARVTPVTEITDIEPDDTFTLRIYRKPGGQWSGELIDSAGQAWGDLGDWQSPQDVEQKARDNGIYPDHVQVEAD